MIMKLIRTVTYTFNPPQDKWKFAKFDDGVVELNTYSTTKDMQPNPNTLLAIAEIKLDDKPKLDEDGTVEIPEIPRKLLERRIEDVANIISVSEKCERRISSTYPYVSFRPENDEERKWLDSTNGIKYVGKSLQEIHFSLQEDFMKNKFLNDRLDGIAILAEAQSCSHLTGKLHEFMRFFERAFTLSSTSLIKPLSDFLEQSEIKIKKEDVVKWIVDLRHPATHADKKEYFVLESDVRPHIYLIEQAAYDVLFNKTKWRGKSIERREAFKPKAGVGNDNIGFIVKNSIGITFQSQILDQFSAYPINLGGALTSIPDEFWFKKFENNPNINENKKTEISKLE